MLTVCTLAFSQEFRRSFDSYSFKNKEATNWTTGKMSSILVFNYKNEPYVKMYAKDIDLLLRITQDPIKKVGVNGAVYQEIRVNDEDGIEGVILLFEDPANGCLLILPTSSLGLFNSNGGRG